MGRFRPRGSRSKRIIGKAVGKGLNEFHRQNRTSNTNADGSETGCLIVAIFIVVILLLAQCGS